MRRIGLAAVAVSAASIVLSGTTPVAASANVPTPTLRIGGYGVTQTPVNYSEVQEDGTPGHCHALIGEGGHLPPRPFLVEPGNLHSENSLHTSNKPPKWTLQVARGDFTGVGTVLPAKLIRHKTRWFVDFTLAVGANEDVYPTLAVTYSDHRPCTSTSSGFGFHLRGARS